MHVARQPSVARQATTQRPSAPRAQQRSGSSRISAVAAHSEQQPCETSTVQHRRSVLSALAAAALALPLGSRAAWAEEAEVAAVAVDAPSTSGSQKIFFDVAIEGEPAGRIVVELFDDVKVGAARFADLSAGKEGVGYRLSRIDGIFDTHLRVEGVKRLSYSATGESSIAGGDSVADLEAEMETPAHRHDRAGLVSLIVKEATERPIQEKLIAKNGKLVTIQLQAGEAPNGTGFMITRAAAPDLDRTNLVVGRVIAGDDVIDRVSTLPYSRPRTEWYDGPFFEAGKAMGDKRATVAEKGFNRPFKRVIITKSGILA